MNWTDIFNEMHYVCLRKKSSWSAISQRFVFFIYSFSVYFPTLRNVKCVNDCLPSYSSSGSWFWIAEFYARTDPRSSIVDDPILILWLWEFMRTCWVCAATKKPFLNRFLRRINMLRSQGRSGGNVRRRGTSLLHNLRWWWEYSEVRVRFPHSLHPSTSFFPPNSFCFSTSRQTTGGDWRFYAFQILYSLIFIKMFDVYNWFELTTSTGNV